MFLWGQRIGELGAGPESKTAWREVLPMPFEVGHQKFGGRRAGTPNRVTAELRMFDLENGVAG